ncbi:MAG: glycosyltransferase [bacterium]
MINIAYVIDTVDSPNAGTEHQLLETIRRLDRSHFTPHLICLRPSDWLAQTSLPCDVEVLNLRSFLSLQTFREQRRFVGYCRTRRIDIIQSFFRDSNLAGTLWGRMAGVPVIIASRRNIGTGYWHNRKEVAILRFLRLFTTQWIANSRAAADEAIMVEKADPHRVRVIPNGLDIDRFGRPTDDELAGTRRRWGLGPEHVVVGAVANLRPVKNLTFLIRVASQMCPSHSNLRFVVLGEGPQRPELEKLIARHDLTGVFLLPGKSSTVAQDLYSFDIAVLCSKGESLSNSLMEYCAAERPAVASDVGGNAEVLDSPEVGMVYPPDDIDCFRQALASLMEDPARAAAIGRAARRSVAERYSFQAVLGQVEGLYRALVRK